MRKLLALLALAICPILGGSSIQFFGSFPAPTSAGLVIKNAWKGFTQASVPEVVTVSPSSGNLLVVCVMSLTADTGLAVSDNIGATTGWVKVPTTASDSDAATLSIWYKPNIGSGVVAITVSTVQNTLFDVIIHEVSGASGATPFTTGEVAGVNGTSASTNPNTGSVTNGTANSIMFAACFNEDGANPGTLTINGTGTTGTYNLFSSTNSQDLNGASQFVFGVANRIVSSSAAQKHGWTTGSFQYGNLLVAFH
jgi:hypothetical protein